MRRAALVLAVMVVAALLMAMAGGMALATSFCADRIEGTSGDDRLIGDRAGPCFDTILGKGGDDLMKGLRLADKLYGGTGADTLYGNRGGDRLEGGRGKDLMYGGSGDDVIFAQDGRRDVIYCGPGFDEVYHDEQDYRGLERRGCEISNPPPVP